MGSFTNIFDNTKPLDTQAANLLGQDLRNLEVNIQQRMAAISGLDAAKPPFGADAQPLAWTGILFFAIDTGIIYQWSGSGWVIVTSSILSNKPQRVAKLVTVVNVAIPTGILYAIPAGVGGLYRVTTDLVTLTADSVGFVDVTISLNNGLAVQSQIGGPLDLTAVGNETAPAMISSFYAIASSNIQLATSYSGTGVGEYQVQSVVEYLG